MLFVVPNACEFSPDNSRCTIVVESDCTGAKLRDAFTDLEGMEPIHMAQQYAASRGCPSFAVNGTPTHPYAVNVNGVSLEQVRGPQNEPLPQTHPLMQPAKYRKDIPLSKTFR